MKKYKKLVSFTLALVMMVTLMLAACSASKTSSRVETLVFDMFSAPVEYMEENYKLFQGASLGVGAPALTEEEADALNAQIEAATAEFEASYENVAAYCTESGADDFFSAMTSLQWTSAAYNIPVEVQSVTVEVLSEKSNTFRFSAELLVDQQQVLEVAGKMQADADGMVTFIDAREASGAVVQVLYDTINAQYSSADA